MSKRTTILIILAIIVAGITAGVFLAISTNKKSSSELTYSNIVKMFLEKRIQFDKDCKANPAELTIKNRTPVMFDNQSGKKIVLSFSGRTIPLEANSYKLSVVSTSEASKTIIVTCNENKESGQIIIQ
jgi:preprotein translocase subunit Sec63